MLLLKRLFKLVLSEAESLTEKLEDPVKMSGWAICDLKIDLQESLRSLAEVKAVHVRLEVQQRAIRFS